MSPVALPAAALAALACPHCGARLTELESGRVVTCPVGHSFDRARHGHLALLAPRARLDTADSAEMVGARVAFLAGGHFGSIAAAVGRAVASVSIPGPVVDMGSGNGYYLSAALDAATEAGGGRVRAGVAMDSSRYAARRAAADPRVAALVADIWSRWPIRDGVVAALLVIFAPRNVQETIRVLAPGGALVTVTPQPDHLHELRTPLSMLEVGAGKAEQVSSAYGDRLVTQDRTDVRRRVPLDRPAVHNLVAMGPTARHLSPGSLAYRVGRLAPVTEVTVAVTVNTLVKSS